MVFAVILIILLFALYISMYHWFTNPVKRIVSVMQKVDEEGIDLKMPELRYGCYDYLLKPVMEDDIIKVMKNLVTKIERERHQAQLQEEGIVWNQLNQYGKKNIGRKCSEDYVMIRTGRVRNMRRPAMKSQP